MSIYGVRVQDNAEYPFAEFVATELGLNVEIPLEPASAKKGAPPRLLCMGYVTEDRKFIAGLLTTPRADRSYSTLKKRGGRRSISLQQLDKDAEDLNFFVYSAHLNVLVYAYRPRGKGPLGFLGLLRPRYHRVKRDAQLSERKDQSREKQKEINQRYKGPLRGIVMAEKTNTERMLARMKKGHLSMPVISPVLKEDDSGIGAFIETSRLHVTVSAEPEDRATFAERIMTFVRSWGGGKGRLVGVDDQDEPLEVDLADTEEDLTLASYDHDDWMKFLDGNAEFDVDTFPFDCNTKELLRPVEVLKDLFSSRKAVLDPEVP